jgi:hypothetical protein
MKFFYYLLTCVIASQALLYSSNTKILGDEQSKETWIYLCGLKDDLASQSTPNETSLLKNLCFLTTSQLICRTLYQEGQLNKLLLV